MSLSVGGPLFRVQQGRRSGPKSGGGGGGAEAQWVWMNGDGGGVGGRCV